MVYSQSQEIIDYLESSPLWVLALKMKTGINRYSWLVLADGPYALELGREATEQAFDELKEVCGDVCVMREDFLEQTRACINANGWELVYNKGPFIY